MTKKDANPDWLADDPEPSQSKKDDEETREKSKIARGKKTTTTRTRKKAVSMFDINVMKGASGVLQILGKSSRNGTKLFNVPVSEVLRQRLDDKIQGSVSMGAAALIEWALDELDKQKIIVQAHPKQQ